MFFLIIFQNLFRHKRRLVQIGFILFFFLFIKNHLVRDSVVQNQIRNRNNRFMSRQMEQFSDQAELVKEAREAAKCKFKLDETNCLVCEKLPYTKIRCGTSYNKARKHNNMSYAVPNIVHLIWFGDSFEMTKFYHYLAIRSIASLQHPDVIYLHHNFGGNLTESGKIWERIVEEIPCFKLIWHEEPLEVFNNKISTHLLRSDVARLEILLQHGGIYVDVDVITLKNVDNLRVYSSTIGRSVWNKISNGIIISEAQSPFLKAWYNEYKYYKEGEKPYSYWGVNIPMQLYLKRPELKVHMEETSLNRPNPWVDGWDSTSIAHIDISDNYFLHLHPSGFLGSENDDVGMTEWDEHKLRKMDSVYSSAARIALFGSQELVYLKGETPFGMWPKRRVRAYDPLRSSRK